MAEAIQHFFEKPITLVPVGLKEAALDSPTFRSGVLHFVDQLDTAEKWLDSYTRSILKISHEVGAFESAVNGFLGLSVPPYSISEAVVDHDYTFLAIKRFGEGAREIWNATILGTRKMEHNMVEPIRAFLQNDLRSFKETRKSLEQTQKLFDGLQARYSAQAKTKEASSIREDAFQLHEARKAYLKASMDFSVMASQIRTALDKMVVRIFSDQWHDMQSPRGKPGNAVFKWGAEIERVRGWSREIENGESSFRHELETARKQLEEMTEISTRPSRDLEDYLASTVSPFGSKGPSTANLHAETLSDSKSTIQGWLNLKTITGKPSRTIWLRRWFFVKNGIFGWLVQGSRSGGVEESDRVGVLLCNVRPATSEERRFAFEVKTKDMTFVLQAETQTELLSWIRTFEMAKRKALEDPTSTDSPGLEGPKTQDAAFAVSSPTAPEFAASTADSGLLQFADDNQTSLLERNSTLPIPTSENGLGRSSTDIGNHRRSTGDRDGESSRDHAARIIQKLDLHRKSTGGPQNISIPTAAASTNPALGTGGIASLIAASHNVMPVGPGVLPQSPPPDASISRPLSAGGIRDLPYSSLAPRTLANPPAPTNLSSTAVVVNGERGLGQGRLDATGGIPSGVMANVWGSSNWGFLNQLQMGEVKIAEAASQKTLSPPSPGDHPLDSPIVNKSASRSPSLSPHRKTISLPGDTTSIKGAKIATPTYPSYYPLQLKMQDAQFRLLFPNVSERIVFVFKATWSLNDQQEFPGRIYVTAKQIYFYSNHLGLILTSEVSLRSVKEVTAAQGRYFDLLFIHIKEAEEQVSPSRVTIKTFLEPLKLLEQRLNFLVRHSAAEEPPDLELLIKGLLDLEQASAGNSTLESWEEATLNTAQDNILARRKQAQKHRDLRALVMVDGGLYDQGTKYDDAKDNNKIKLPKRPVDYIPVQMGNAVIEKLFDISPKALFHVMFGDRSAVFYSARSAQRIKQGSWTQSEQKLFRREFEYQIEYQNTLGREHQANIVDYQMIDVLNDHLCYVVTDRRTPWHMPFRQSFTLLNKIVITHYAKSKCKLAIYAKVDWISPPWLIKGTIEKEALEDLRSDALDLADVVTDQVKKLGARSRTKKAIEIFGQIGQQTQVSEFTGNDAPVITQSQRSTKRRTIAGLFFESLGSLMKSVITSMMVWILGTFRWLNKTINANRLILGLLASSMIGNVFFSSSTTTNWWSERRAGNLMLRLGVGPNPVMSKTIYLEDLKELVRPELDFWEDSPSLCTEVDAPQQSTGGPHPRPLVAAYAKHFGGSRQRLGSYRHELLVAMRVVNSIEREVIKAEWERWLLSENGKCKQIGKLLDQRDGLLPHDGGGKQHDRKTVRVWHSIYCSSCSREQAQHWEKEEL
ncbi:MAG: hypothetical protein LQ351_006768 [Letrouitia transgressa]|nr:MAG: hypothetical protein LQ351_006768 [Letrouitia transgressa]